MATLVRKRTGTCHVCGQAKIYHAVCAKCSILIGKNHVARYKIIVKNVIYCEACTTYRPWWWQRMNDKDDDGWLRHGKKVI